MNGKTGSRLIARVRPKGGASASFRRDVHLLKGFAQDQKHLKSLVWLEPSDGQSSISYSDLAPALYIDCARRIRMARRADGVVAWYATSEKARVNADAAAGVTGDPYAPIKPERDASITPKRETFGYRGITRLFKADLPILSALHRTDDANGLDLNFSALVRRGGTDTNTEGFFERRISTSRVEELEELGPTKVFDRVGNAAKRRSEEAGEASRRLRRALILLVQGGPDQARMDDDAAGRKVEPWLRQFDVIIDHEFFGDPLWDEAVGKAIAPRRVWRERLREVASGVLAQAAEAAPRTEMRRIRAIARSHSMLNAQMHNWLKEVPDGE